MILILGASGLVGRPLFDSFKSNHVSVIGTNYYPFKKNEVTGTYYNSFDENLIYYDISTMQFDDLDIDYSKVSHVVICTASTTILDEVRRKWDNNPREEYFSNITKIIEIFEFCFQHNIVPIFMSSDGVFDGIKGDYSENDKPNPVHRYGLIKYELEKYLIKSKQDFLIFRFGKVISESMNDQTLFTEIISKLLKNQEQQLATDHTMTPVHLGDLIYFIRIAILKQLKGILHLASMKPMNRFDFAIQAAKFFKIENPNIKPCKINSLGLIEKRPKKNDLNVGKMKKITKFQLRPKEYFFELIRKKMTVP